MDFLKSVILPVIASSVLFTNLNKHNANTSLSQNKDTITALSTDTNAITKQESLQDLENPKYWQKVAMDFENNVDQKSYKKRINDIASQIGSATESKNRFLPTDTSGINLSDTIGNNVALNFHGTYGKTTVDYSYLRTVNITAHNDTIYNLKKQWSISTDSVKLQWKRTTHGARSASRDTSNDNDSVGIHFISQAPMMKRTNSSKNMKTKQPQILNKNRSRQPQ